MSEPGCKANEAADKIVDKIAATEAKDMGTWANIPQLIERYGFATLACLGIAWFANTAIEYEREKMGPALEANTKAIERNSEVIRQLPEAFRKERKNEADEAKGHQ